VTSTGTVSWARIYGGAGADEGWRVIQHPSGGYVLVGSTGSWGPGIVSEETLWFLELMTRVTWFGERLMGDLPQRTMRLPIPSNQHPMGDT
jgi:hypothetical protein